MIFRKRLTDVCLLTAFCVARKGNSTFFALGLQYTCEERNRRDILQITIYMDIIFLINFLANLFVLYLTGRILKKKIVVWKLIGGAMFGAIVLLALIFSPSLLIGWRGIVISVGISMGTVAIPYGERKLAFIRTWFLATTIMILTGGIMNYFRYISGDSITHILQWIFLFGISGVCICGFVLSIRQALNKADNIYLVQIKHGDFMTVETVYMDTGNMLKDPIFQKPVVVLNEDVVNKCLMEDARDIIETYKERECLDYKILLSNTIQQKNCFHEIAYQSVGNPSGKLLCMLMDEISILGKGKVLYKQPVAIVPNTLFKGKDYQGLLYKDCL